MGTNCAPLIADLFLFAYERDFMLRLSPGSQFDIIKAFNNTSIYVDDILNMDNPYLLAWYLLFIHMCLCYFKLIHLMTYF